MDIHELEPLKGVNVPIVAPKLIPKSLRVERVAPLIDDQSGEGYEIAWRSDTAELRLRAASSGIGDQVGGGERIPFDTRYFGECFLEKSGDRIVSEWFSEMESGVPAYSVTANGLDPDDVIEFVRSLDYVRVN